MEKPYRPGVCYYPGGFSYDDATINSIPVGAVRVFCQTEQVNEQEFRWIGDRVRAFQDRGKKVIGTLTEGNAANWIERPNSEWTNIITKYAEKVPVKVVEVGNEPGKGAFINQPNGYFSKLKIASDILRAKGINVVSGAPYPSAVDAYYSELDRLGGWDWIDSVGFHPYRKTPQGSLDWIKSLRGKLDSFGVDHYIQITEFGWAAKGLPHDFVVGETQQANYLKQAFANWYENWDTLKLAFVMWYIWKDWPPNSTLSNWIYYCGVLRPDNSKRQSYTALANVDR